MPHVPGPGKPFMLSATYVQPTAPKCHGLAHGVNTHSRGGILYYIRMLLVLDGAVLLVCTCPARCPHRWATAFCHAQYTAGFTRSRVWEVFLLEPANQWLQSPRSMTLVCSKQSSPKLQAQPRLVGISCAWQSCVSYVR